MGRKANLTDERFGRLLAVKESLERNKQGGILWECKCDCGEIRLVSVGSLRSGNTTSCGCKGRESLVKRNTSHAMASSRLYSIWCGMITRCTNPNQDSYVNYGGRGIEVSSGWDISRGGGFENFLHDMQDGYVDGMTLERLDVNGNYCKENCIWVSKKEQALNKRRYKNNKTGVAGISERDVKCGKVLFATVQNPETGKPVIKIRNLRFYEKEEAMKFLIEWLEKKRREFGYSETHGSD